jgi:hypothetical protein
MPGGSSKGGKVSKGKNDAPAPAGVLQRGVWSVDRNDRNGLKYDDAEASIKAVIPSGEFNADYSSFCEALNLVPHPQVSSNTQCLGTPAAPPLRDQFVIMSSCQPTHPIQHPPHTDRHTLTNTRTHT